MATIAQAKTFIATIGPIIQKYAKQYGYQVSSPIIAQACCESAYGTSSLAWKYHNYFGMKCGSSWKGASVNMNTKEEYSPGTLTSIKANFRAYGSMEEGVKGYFEFIQASRYANLKTATTAQRYLELIKQDGYATSSTYVNTNMNIVNKYGLTVYDTGTVVSAVDTSTAAVSYTVGKTYTLQVELKVRTGAGTNYAAKKHSQLTSGGMKCDKDGDGALDKGTRVTCQEVKHVGSDIWMRVPSGWLAAYYSGHVYVK